MTKTVTRISPETLRSIGFRKHFEEWCYPPRCSEEKYFVGACVRERKGRWELYLEYWTNSEPALSFVPLSTNASSTLLNSAVNTVDLANQERA